jgi:pyridoxine 4-dehydrogenase
MTGRFAPEGEIDHGWQLSQRGSPLGGKRGLKALKIKQVALRRGLTHAALSLAWLLAKSPVMLPIAGTQSIEHLEDNVLAAALKLEPDDFDDLQ